MMKNKRAKIISNSPPRHNFKIGSIVEVLFVDLPTKLYPHTLVECKQNSLEQTVERKDLKFIE